MGLLAMCVSSLEKSLFRSSTFFFFLIFFFFYIVFMNMSCLCILEINPLSVVSYANIFPYSESFLLILFTISFAVRKLLSLVRSHFFKICFYFHWIKKHHMVIYVKDVLSLFSSKSFIVSAFTFRSLIHFEFIFVYGIWECAILILLHVAVQLFQNHLLKRLSFPHCIFLLPLLKITWP